MELIWTAFLLGLVGSLHCAVMCGPLILAMASSGRPQSRFHVSRFFYHTGRIATYCLIGLLFGAVGKTFVLAGVQRWVAIFAGAAIFAGLLCSTRFALNAPFARLVVNLKSAFGRLLQRRTLASQFILGAINGLLPCGLVYIAAAGAAATLNPVSGALHMAVFGAGTLPMLLSLSLVGHRLAAVGVRFRSLIPVSAALVAMLLLLRGMALGIPYLSPTLNEHAHTTCH
jgi:sulfite exporter TauE/SafE